MSNLPKESAHHFPLNLTSIASMRQNRSVLIERAQYYAILAEREHTIRKGVLIEGGGALTEGVQFIQKSLGIMINYVSFR